MRASERDNLLQSAYVENASFLYWFLMLSLQVAIGIPMFSLSQLGQHICNTVACNVPVTRDPYQVNFKLQSHLVQRFAAVRYGVGAA